MAVIILGGICTQPDFPINIKEEFMVWDQLQMKYSVRNGEKYEI